VKDSRELKLGVKQTEFAIVGAGPTGIGAALRLLELGHRDFVVIDAAEAPGGLASSFTDPAGFTWDLGGHVQFSHYRKFDEYMDLALPPEDWLWHERESWIWFKDRFIPYPFQNNLHRLAPEERWRAVEGLVHARGAAESGMPGNFREWILASFGTGIADLFLFPYNFKVWGHPLDQMDARWVGERVAVPSLDEVLKSICLEQDQVSWGPNRRFRFPRRGGTGAVWRSLGRRIPDANLKMLCKVDAIDARRRMMTFYGGEQLHYRNLINTAPLDWLCRAISDNGLAARTARLKSSVVHVIGIGLKGAPPESLRKMCWMYFPGPESSFYRVTVFSNYSPYNVPQHGATWSLMAEVAETGHLPRSRSRVVDEVVQQMISIGLIPDAGAILSRWHKILDPGYPTPSLERDAILNDALPALEAQNIYSRGRFGAWKYEVSNQDHSFMQGVEVADHLVLGRSEPTLNRPGKVNQNYNSFPYVEDEAA
jgi:protoporphyrinogen oxidase